MLQEIFVRGEVSSCKYHSSGHIYFTLKDDGRGTIDCVMYASSRGGLRFLLKEGQQVIVEGKIATYDRESKYQLYARQIMLDGVGQIYEQFELLKRQLEEMGMFAPEYKKPIPKYIRTLGVVTADTGKAIRDIIQVTRRRNPYVQIILYPAIVQGDAAVDSIIRGICALERLPVDVMIVGRGGGATEGLWTFNDRRLAQAVFDCSVPVISAVGHETDVTIIDYVADLRAPTPSAAAELAVADIRQVLERMEGYEEQLRRRMERKLVRLQERSRQYERQLQLLSPASRVRERRNDLLRMEEKLEVLMKRLLRGKRHELSLYIEKMKGLSPLEKLNSGYSYVEDEQQRNVRSVEGVSLGQRLVIRVRDGRIGTRVTDLEGEKVEE